MVFLIEHLNGNVAKFAKFCVENYSIEELIHSSSKGIDHAACTRWGITEEEWQNAIFSVLKELRHS